MPRFILVCHAAAGNNLITLDATGSKLVFVTSGTIDFLFARNETLRSNWILAYNATETLLVPLPGLVLHFLRTGTEDLATSIASARKLGIVTVTTVNLVDLATELFIHQGDSALVAEKAGLVPMLVLVRKILGVDSNNFIAFLATIGKYTLVTLDTVWMLIS